MIYKLLLALSLGVFVLTVVLILLFRRAVRKLMLRLDGMLRAAMDGSFHEMTFDETQLSQLESTLAQYLAANEISQQNLAAEKDSIKTLIADISHQSKTPIANLLLYAELLEEQQLPPEAAQYAAQIHTQAEKLRFLIDSLVKLSRLEAGIITLHPASYTLSDMLHTLRAQYAPAAAAKGLSLCVPDCDEQALFDEKWTLEALGNVVDNAIKYTDSGSVRISVQPLELFVRIDVADTGGGIRETEQAAIFGRFYRSPAVSRQPGVGIGLFLTRKILAAQGGFIRVRSSPGHGAVFSLYLPAAQPGK